jgi:hypothetical protein
LQSRFKKALVAKLVDAADSKSAVRKNVPVRVRPRAQNASIMEAFFAKRKFQKIQISKDNLLYTLKATPPIEIVFPNKDCTILKLHC